VGEREEVGYLALEYVTGGSLRERLAGVPQRPRPAAQLLETLARAIHYAHERGVVHRDLKPANILLASGDTLARSASEGRGEVLASGGTLARSASEGERDPSLALRAN